MELLQTGQPAPVHNPDCTDQPAIDAGRLVAQLGAAAIDAYVGYPVATPLVRQMDQGQFNWFSARMGLHNGGSHCATQCIIVPAAAYKNSREEVCMSETGGNGLECHSDDAEYPWGWMGHITSKRTSSGASVVVCAFAKNWSDNRNRWFILRSTY